jgi:hypothetical protein
MGNFWNKPVKPNQTSLEEDNWTEGLRIVLLENIQPLEAAENTTETVTKVKQMIEDNIQTYKEMKQAVLNGEEIDEDWATKSNWICIDHLCPNPYTHDPHGGPGLRGVLRGHGPGRRDDAPLWLPRVDSKLVF